MTVATKSRPVAKKKSPAKSKITEASKAVTSRPQNLSMAWDDSFMSLPGVQVKEGLLSERDKKDTYYQVFLGNVWVSACCNVIAQRIVSGGWEISPVIQGKGNEANRDRLKMLLMYVNDDDDFLQLIRGIVTDLLVFGEAYVEIVYQAGVPVQLHKIDCITMTTHFDQHGNITGYTQTLDRSQDSQQFTPEQIIRWWFPDPRASKKAISRIEHIKDAVYLYSSMTTWAEKFFKQGARPNFSIEMGPDSQDDDARRYVKFYKENYTGLTNAHVPPITYAGARLNVFGAGSVDMDFTVGRDRCRNEILTGFGVPPALVGVIETGNIGGGTGDSQEKSFRYNTVEPVKKLILEKLNYRLLKAFNITDWFITTRYADYRDDHEIAQVQDIQIRNGAININEARHERGLEPVPGGDENVIVASRDIIPVRRLSELADEMRLQAQQALQKNQPPSPQPSTPPTERDAKRREDSTLHWQDTDTDTQLILDNLRNEGVKGTKWKAHVDCCAACAKNDGLVRAVGEKFPSGAYLPPEHNHCICEYEDTAK